MSTGIEPVDIVDPWLYETLSGDAQITDVVGTSIFADGAPGPQRLPAVTWNMNSARDVLNQDGVVLWSECLFEIKAIGQGASYKPIAALAARVDALIGAFNGQTSHGYVTCRRERVIRYPEVDDNVQYRHLGAVYRITAHTT